MSLGVGYLRGTVYFTINWEPYSWSRNSSSFWRPKFHNILHKNPHRWI